MTAFDTDVFTELATGDPGYLMRLGAIPVAQRYLPVVVADEVLRGRLATVRAAEAGKGRATLDVAYGLLEHSLRQVGQYQPLSYSAAADAQFRVWRAARLKVGIRDLRIAASCFVVKATLVTRNARDFALVPGLKLDIWP